MDTKKIGGIDLNDTTGSVQPKIDNQSKSTDTNVTIDVKTQTLLKNLGLTIDYDLNDFINKLAGLSFVQYEHNRKTAAKFLDFRETALDQLVNEARKKSLDDPYNKFWPDQKSIDQWCEPVDGDALLTILTGTVKRFIICEDEYAKAIALWIIFTWAIDYVNIAPLLMITAPEKRCGKSVLLEFISKLSLKPLTASSITASTIYRLVQQVQPTLCIDEADTFLKTDEALRGIIDSGHTRSTAFKFLTDPNTLQVERYSTWCAKAIAGIGGYHDTIMDRSIIIKLRRKLPHESVAKLRFVDPELFITLKRKILRWVNDHADELRNARPETVYDLNDRAADSWEPLFAIADAAGSNWSKIARDICTQISDDNNVQSITTELLSDIREIFALKKVDRISSADLLNALFEDEDKPWKTWNRGFGMKAHQLAKKIGEHGIKSKDMRFGGHGVLKGYSLDMFTEVFKRYLDEPAMTQNQISNSILNASNDGNNYRSNVINLKITSNNFSFKNITKMCDFRASDEYDDYMNDPDYIEFQDSLDNGDDDQPDDRDDSLIGYAN